MRPQSTTRRRWSDADDALLRLLYESGCPSREIAARLARTWNAVNLRANALGLTHPKFSPPHTRFMAKIEVSESGCWEWQGFVGNPDGYGRFGVDGSVVLAHRWSYEHFVGSIPKGLQIDHLCRNRQCVNPEHLEAVPQRINILRGAAPAIEIHRQQTCARGHGYAEHSLYRDGKRIYCRTCEAENQRIRRQRRRQSDGLLDE